MTTFQIKISFFKGVYDNDPATITFQEFLDKFGYYEHIVKRIRKGKVALKQTLPACTPCGVFEGGRTGKLYPSGFAGFDVDYVEDMDKTREIIKSFPWVYYMGTSVSGNGIWGLVRFWDTEQYIYHYAAMIQKFLDAGITSIDPSTCDMTRLRFISMLDGTEYLNEDAKIFSELKYDMLSTKDGKRPDTRVKYKYQFRREDIQKMREFNEAHTCEQILEQAGWTVKSGNHRGQIHVLRPGGTKSTSGNIKDNRFWCFTPSTELEQSKLYRPFDLYVHLMTGGDIEGALFSL